VGIKKRDAILYNENERLEFSWVKGCCFEKVEFSREDSLLS
jgi:hypothetical protein